MSYLVGHRATGHLAFGLSLATTHNDTAGFWASIIALVDVSNRHVHGVQVAVVGATAGVAGHLDSFARHGVWLGVDAGSANFFAHHFVTEFSHD